MSRYGGGDDYGHDPYGGNQYSENQFDRGSEYGAGNQYGGNQYREPGYERSQERPNPDIIYEEDYDSSVHTRSPLSETLATLENEKAQSFDRPPRAERPPRPMRPARPDSLFPPEVPEDDESAYSPDEMRPTSRDGSRGSSSSSRSNYHRYFHSRRIRKGTVEKPWLKKSDPKDKWATIFPLMGIVIGLGIAAFLIWDGLRSVVHHKYCLVLDDDFSSGFNTKVWTKDVQVGGFGLGQFQMTTGGERNVYVDNGTLIIKAEPQNHERMERPNTINLHKTGTCTGKGWKNCVAATNLTAGNTSVVPPALSGRIHTMKGATIKYGRVEVTARFPEGDWLWPSIGLLPVANVYGPWPRSGQIDIAQSRGNNHSYIQGGNDIVNSAIHWGLSPSTDVWWKTNAKRQALRTTYSHNFHTFGLEWSQKYLFTYVNNRLIQVTYTNFKKNMWQRGGFSEFRSNGTRVTDPWSETGDSNAPFDEKFYLVIGLAVGGTNGWFADDRSGKPWADNSTTAKRDFWTARKQWEPTWKRPTIEVKRVKMLQQCDGNEEL